ncbi:hypothetical protein AXK11_01435 [Cephaloticoccus primus]|uniref:Plasmid pRiA4b Orf3-like domain-containing protein n=1 Tax=Cephaloticoccus primus TaxID=1548207 RepID=A0A139STS1_9BACT|nr:plasmid pRiA4b ORF-3 family protein [Cephaloticoccus primus]KXU37989.1 hypothetical protein AXK11_01435 [Cephaloticoccus primus]
MISLLEGGGAKPGKKAQDKVLLLRLGIIGSEPPIWRRLVVRESMWLSQLHEAIQVLFDWFDYQTHTFLLGDMRAGSPVQQGELLVEDDRDITLVDLNLEQLGEFVYEYHFGETWRVGITLEKVGPVEPGHAYPQCIAGERAGPPEDCGGLEAFADMLHCIQEPESELGKEWLQWLGESYDPTQCDLEKINKTLRKQLRGT